MNLKAACAYMSADTLARMYADMGMVDGRPDYNPYMFKPKMIVLGALREKLGVEAGDLLAHKYQTQQEAANGKA